MHSVKKVLPILFWFSGWAQAQQLPNHDIYLLDIDARNEKDILIDNIRVVAASEYYENQPRFVGNDKLVFTRDNGKNTDIWQWHKGQLSSLSETDESEYSPTPLPNDLSTLSMIRVEKDGTQRLWKRTSEGVFEMIFEDIKPVGYHAWQDDNVAMFVLGEPHRLETSRLGEQKSNVVDENIGRCLQRIPASTSVSYTIASEPQQLKSFDFTSRETTVLGALPNGAQDYIWISDKRLLATSGNQLYLGMVTSKIEWLPIEADLPEGTYSRLALSSNGRQLALVVAPK